MIRGIDFYNYVLEKAKQHSNIYFYYGTVDSIANENHKAVITVDKKQFSSNFIFNSILFNTPLKDSDVAGSGFHYLLQHFKGWLIETSANIFDDRIATFMDFRVNQDYGTAFIYLLPVALNRAMIEYTLFTEQLLQPHQYDEALEQYISEFLKLDDYIIKEEEFGAIPMTNYPFSKGEGRIVNIGTAGGQTKASSGYAFRFIQKHADAIINTLMNDKDPHIASSFIQRRFHLYDSTLLNILHHKKMSGDKIFSDLFKKNPPQRVLRFLDNETNFSEELKIMSSVPPGIFLPAAIKEFFR
jgi:lycopene beta-cyclase